MISVTISQILESKIVLRHHQEIMFQIRVQPFKENVIQELINRIMGHHHVSMLVLVTLYKIIIKYLKMAVHQEIINPILDKHLALMQIQEIL